MVIKCTRPPTTAGSTKTRVRDEKPGWRFLYSEKLVNMDVV